jgi:hypothetical protein
VEWLPVRRGELCYDAGTRAARYRTRGGESRMRWETPGFLEVKMDAEVTSYQEDVE